MEEARYIIPIVFFLIRAIFYGNVCFKGADITDYFNYGFTEETWAAYCSRQKRIRINESGAGLPNNPSSSTNVSNTMSSFGMKSQNGGTIPTLGNQGIKRLGTSGTATSTIINYKTKIIPFFS